MGPASHKLGRRIYPALPRGIQFSGLFFNLGLGCAASHRAAQPMLALQVTRMFVRCQRNSGDKSSFPTCERLGHLDL